MHDEVARCRLEAEGNVRDAARSLGSASFVARDARDVRSLGCRRKDINGVILFLGLFCLQG